MCVCARGCVCASACLLRCVAASMRMCGVHVCLFATYCEHICVRAQVRVCARVCARARARAFLCLHAFVCACERVLPIHRQSIFANVLRVRVRNDCVCMPRRGAGAVVARRGPAVLMARPAAPGGRACAPLRFGAIGFRCRARSAAGVTWTCRTASAPWAARWFHTSVVDAVSGTIYVIGGQGDTFYSDVWASTDGGA